jgi:hypothetical protein
MEAVRSSQTMANTYMTTLCHNQEDYNQTFVAMGTSNLNSCLYLRFWGRNKEIILSYLIITENIASEA